MSSRKLFAVVAALGAAFAGQDVHAQDARLPALYGTMALQWAFEPDPITVNVRTGLDVALSGVGAPCVGFATSAPSYEFTYTAGLHPLYFVAQSTGDAVLMVRSPDGLVYCIDDTYGQNPEVAFPSPLTGTYDIWVGSYSAVSIDAALSITEIQPSMRTAVRTGTASAPQGATDDGLICAAVPTTVPPSFDPAAAVIDTTSVWAQAYDLLADRGAGMGSTPTLIALPGLQNAVATTLPEVGRIVAYDPQWFDVLSAQHGSGAALFILAHELGHHVNGHTIDLLAGSTAHAREFEADAFATRVFYVLGGGLEEAQGGISALGRQYESTTHPSSDQRLLNVAAAWRDLESNCQSGFGACPNPNTIAAAQPPPNPVGTATTCYTNGGSCQLLEALPVGGRCWCSANNDLYWGWIGY